MPAWCLVLGGSFHTTSVGKCLYDSMILCVSKLSFMAIYWVSDKDKV